MLIGVALSGFCSGGADLNRKANHLSWRAFQSRIGAYFKA